MDRIAARRERHLHLSRATATHRALFRSVAPSSESADQARIFDQTEQRILRQRIRAPSLEQVASIVYLPSYVSCESALFMHGVADPAPHLLTCVTTNKTKTFRTGLRELFFGYEAWDRALVAEPEKAALDFVYIQRQNGLQPALDEWNWEELSLDKLSAMGTVYPRAVREHIAKYAPKVKSPRR